MIITVSLERLADQFAIQQLLARYARGVDRVDIDLIRSVYWLEAVDDHGTFYGSGDAFADELATRLPGNYELTSHMLGQTWFHMLEAGSAETETYFLAKHLTRDGGGTGFTLNGRYLDGLEKRGGVWKILHRKVVIDLSSSCRFEDGPLRGLTFGKSTCEDASYGFFTRAGSTTDG